ncbi:hypothetical protein [Halobacterium bonnevillei]|uniref:Uncharacterized protein n=1 Tax=Halobacterium bonnevillei TaxID=2692200 RepID=A0A6B0SLJ5_9EURY|nr:hypothetical protein [Halobacterium bonnevillei]MXR20373.1 hypothetical protein [Halobacterium bonnevillei]
MSEEYGGGTGWYGTRWGRLFYWGILVATLVGVALSMEATNLSMRVPPAIYLFGFLGATVYVFTSFAQQFEDDDQYRLKILSRTVAVLPLAAGVYLLALAFPGIDGDLTVLAADTSGSNGATQTDRLVAGVAFLAGIYVSTTLKALGGLAERLLGVSQGQTESAGEESGSKERADGISGDGSETEEPDSEDGDTEDDPN